MTEAREPDTSEPPAEDAPATQRSRALAIAALCLGACAFIPAIAELLPPMCVAGLEFFCGLAAIVVGIIALTGRRSGKRIAVVGLVAGMVGMGFWTAWRPPFSEYVRSAICGNNLNSIGKGIALYMGEDEKAMPPTLKHLVVADVVSNKRLTCPFAKGDNQGLKYFYLPAPANASQDTVIACGQKGNHVGGRNVLFADFGVQWMDGESLQLKLAEKQNAAFAKALGAAEGR